MCNMGTYETCIHFLLHCPLYQDIRESYFTSFGMLREKFCALSAYDKLKCILNLELSNRWKLETFTQATIAFVKNMYKRRSNNNS